MSNKINGLVTISRPSTGATDLDDDSSVIEITIKDEASRVEFVSMRMRLADFAECVTGLAMRPAQGEVRGLHLVGRKHRVGSVMVPFPEAFRKHLHGMGERQPG